MEYFKFIVSKENQNFVSIIKVIDNQMTGANVELYSTLISDEATARALIWPTTRYCSGRPASIPSPPVAVPDRDRQIPLQRSPRRPPDKPNSVRSR